VTRVANSPPIRSAARSGRTLGRPHRTEKARGGQTNKGAWLPYSPGLDGLRAFAVIAVLLYHAGLSWIPGGFLGVEVFFVISGYLITALLLAEWHQRGRIDLKGFWLRRARRLLPALYLMLLVTLTFAVVFLPGEVAKLRSDAIAAFGYVTNWYLVFGHESYFESVGRPSLLKHLWSLAVEEQFYLLWPPMLAAALSLGALRWRRRRALLLALAGAAASALLMAILYRPDLDPSRIYFGTDTRATGLLLGAALAFVWAPGRSPETAETDHSSATKLRRLYRVRRRGRLRRRWGWAVPVLLDTAGLAALGGLIWFCLWLGEYQPFLYQGGFACVALTTVVVITAVVDPRTLLGATLLGWAPLRWIGLRSYGIYLWHWPVFMVTRPQLDLPIEGWPLLGLRLAATIVLAHLSYHYVETPIRRGALERAWKALREARGFQRWELGLRWAGTIAPIVVFCAVLGVTVAHAKAPEPPSYLSSMKPIHSNVSDGAHESSTATKSAPTDERISSNAAMIAAQKRTISVDAQNAQAKTRERAATSAPAGPVTAIGDSVLLGSVVELQRRIDNLTIVDAQVGLQVSTAIDILRARRAAGQLGNTVIVHLGTNGTFTTEQFDEMMDVLAGVDRVVFVNTKVPRTWEQPNNQVIAEGTQRYPNTVLVDWYSATVNRPELFAPDGIHPEPAGRRLYAEMIAAAVEEPR
jgi:peptidoglycan/LPS O-acetylase OafA/YrhL